MLKKKNQQKTQNQKTPPKPNTLFSSFYTIAPQLEIRLFPSV